MPKKKNKTIRQRAGYIRRRLKREGNEILTDYKGQDVPVDWVPAIDLVEHFETVEFINEAIDLRRRLSEFKHRVQSTGDDIYRQILEDNGVAEKEIKNYSLSSLDKKHKVEFKRPPKYSLDEKELAISRDYKMKFYEEMAGDIPKWLVSLIEELIEDSKGDVDQGKLARLNKMVPQIPSNNFKQMVNHYNQARDAYYAKRYENFYVRDEQGQEKSIVLTYSYVSPIDPTAEEADPE